MRVVIELKREAMAEVVLNQLYRFTPLQTSFGVNMLALNGGKPLLMNLKDVVAAFVAFREQVVLRRTAFELGRTRERAHVLVGLAIAVANIDAVIALIRRAPDPNTAREELMGRAWPAKDVEPLVKLIDEPGRGVAEDGTYRLSEAQARAILDLRLQRLTGLERDKIAEELQELAKSILDFLDILESRKRRLDIMRSELAEVKTEFATPRRTTLEELEFEHDVEALIQQEDMVVTVTHGGYIKRVPLAAYRAQRRGGKGRAGMATREEDFVSRLFVADTHRPVLFFSTRGMVYKTKVYKLPEGTPQSRGKALVNMLPLQEGEKISTVLPLPADEASWETTDILFATAGGDVRRNKLSDFVNVKASGKIAMKLAEGDRLIGVSTCTEAEDVLLATRRGRCIRFPVTDVQSLQQPHLDRRARHPARQGGRGDLPRHAAPHVCRHCRTGGFPQGDGGAAPDRRGAGGGGDGTCRAARPLRRAQGGGGIHPRRHRQRLRQAFLGLRIPDHRAGRARHRQYRAQRAQWRRRRRLPGGRRRPDHAGDGRRPAHPLPGPRHPRRRAQDPGRRAVQGRRGRTRGLGRPSGRGRAGTRRGRSQLSRNRVAIYPGTFDPITNGHIDIIRRAARLVDRLVIGVSTNAGKGPLFAVEERVAMVQAEVEDLALPPGNGSVEVRAFDNLLMHFAQSVGAHMILRGLRAVSDFEYEFQMAGMNSRLDPAVETVFLMASDRHQFISSRFVKEIGQLGGDINSFVSAKVAARLAHRFAAVQRDGSGR